MVTAVALTVSGTACVGLAVGDRPPTAPELLRPAGLLAPGPSRPPLQPVAAAPAAAVPVPAVPAAAPPPVELVVPAIGVRTSLLRLGLTAEGALEVPAAGPDHDSAAWYRYSPSPGSVGPAIIVGHVDSVNGPSVFSRLGRLRRQDRVLVTREDGSVAVFAVDAVRRYRKSDFPSGLVYGNTDRATLRLISCAGPIDPDTGHYRDNVVVFASLVGRPGRARPVRPPAARPR
jgi:hypothetical protein